MSDIVKKANEILTSTSHQKIASSSLAGKVKKTLSKEAVLIDISGSMADVMENGKTKYVATVEVLNNIKDTTLRTFQFSNTCMEITNRELERPGGGTNLHSALTYVSMQNISHVILVTDGIPDSEELALQAARGTGLKIDVLYIGPDPIPNFLKQLGAVGNGIFDRIKLGQIGGTTLLTSKIKGLLGA